MGLKRILFTGSRNWDDVRTIWEALEELQEFYAPHGFVVVHGKCPQGADDIVDEAARGLGLPRITDPAFWDRDGNEAGKLRNVRMLEENQPYEVHAFWDGRSPGTKHCMLEARRRGIEVWRYEPWFPGAVRWPS